MRFLITVVGLVLIAISLTEAAPPVEKPSPPDFIKCTKNSFGEICRLDFGKNKKDVPKGWTCDINRLGVGSRNCEAGLPKGLTPRLIVGSYSLEEGVDTPKGYKCQEPVVLFGARIGQTTCMREEIEKKEMEKKEIEKKEKERRRRESSEEQYEIPVASYEPFQETYY